MKIGSNKPKQAVMIPGLVSIPPAGGDFMTRLRPILLVFLALAGAGSGYAQFPAKASGDLS